MNGIDGLFFPGFVLVFLTWLALSGYVLVSRLIHDRRSGVVRRAYTSLQEPELQHAPAAERARRIERILANAPRRTIDRIAADASVPQATAETFSAYAVMRWGSARLLRDASNGRRGVARWRRVAALRILSHGSHPELLPLLRRALQDGDPELAGVAVNLLGRMSDRHAAQLLSEALRHGVYPPSRIATLLDEFPLPIGDLLRDLLRDESPVARFWAATLLARYPETEGLEVELAGLTGDLDPRVRKAAIETLGRTGGRHAADKAVQLLEDSVWYVRAHAARALGDLRRADLAGRVLPLLADPEWWVRLAARESLEAMGPAVVPNLVASLDHPDRFARNGASEVLQNLGFLDRLVTEMIETAGPDPMRVAVLRKAVSAGGAGLVEALIGRAAAPHLAAVHRLLESLGLEPARGD